MLQQYAGLKRSFPDAVMDSDMKSYLSWEETLRSSPLGEQYRIKITYRIGESPNVFVIDPQKLELASGENRLPHVYDHEKQHLCLYLAPEWTSFKSIVNTIVPWTIEWLYHYELWTIDGQWKGGGTVH